MHPILLGQENINSLKGGNATMQRRQGTSLSLLPQRPSCRFVYSLPPPLSAIVNLIVCFFLSDQSFINWILIDILPCQLLLWSSGCQQVLYSCSIMMTNISLGLISYVFEVWDFVYFCRHEKSLNLSRGTIQANCSYLIIPILRGPPLA